MHEVVLALRVGGMMMAVGKGGEELKCPAYSKLLQTRLTNHQPACLS